MASNNKPLLSIIVPVFNTGHYLHKLVESLCAGYLGDAHFEIIFIDDKSTDNTVDVIKKIISNFNSWEMHLITLDVNQGQAAARNCGIKVAKGDYVFFLDSDDYLVKSSLPVIMDVLISERPDAMVFEMDYVSENGDFICSTGVSSNLVLFEKTVNDNHHLLGSLMSHSKLYVTPVIFKSVIVQQHLFIEGKKFEDVMTIPKYLALVDSYVYHPMSLVCYRQHAHSTIAQLSDDELYAAYDAFEYIVMWLKQEQSIQCSESLLFAVQSFNVHLFWWRLIHALKMNHSTLASQHKTLVQQFRRMQKIIGKSSLPLQMPANFSQLKTMAFYCLFLLPSYLSGALGIVMLKAQIMLSERKKRRGSQL